jgi:hypothetical protein
MKKLFILFLITNFYNVHASQNSIPSLPTDMQNLATIVHGTLNNKNKRELTISCKQDTDGRILRISTGLASIESFHWTYPEGNQELEAVQNSLPDSHTDADLDKLLRIIKLKEIGRVIVVSKAPFQMP